MLPHIVLGGGGHAKVLVDMLQASGQEVLGFTSLDATVKSLLGVPCLGTDDALHGYGPSAVLLVNGIGSVGSTSLRQEVYRRFAALDYTFATVIHPSATVARSATLGQGVQVMAGAVVQPDTVIAENCIVNTRCSVDHDCHISRHVHIAPGAVLSGGVTIGEGSHVGTGACVIQGITIGENCIIGAGAVVTEDVPDNTTVVGVPARRVSK